MLTQRSERLGPLFGTILGALVLAGCTSAGPFVTDISPDGRGGFVVQKAVIQFNGFAGTVSTIDPTSYKIYPDGTVDAAPADAAAEDEADAGDGLRR